MFMESLFDSYTTNILKTIKTPLNSIDQKTQKKNEKNVFTMEAYFS